MMRGIVCLFSFLIGLQGYHITEEELNWIIQIHYTYCKGDPCDPNITLTGDIQLLQLPENVPRPALYRKFCYCSCDLDFCMHEDACCPDLISRIESIESEKYLTKMCLYPQLKQSNFACSPSKDPVKYPGPKMSVKMIDSCYRNNTEIQTMASHIVSSSEDKCNRRNSSNDLISKMPVSDLFMGRTYINRECAYCNGQSDKNLAYWNPNILCSGRQFSPRSLETLSEDILHAESCNIVYTVPTGAAVEKCQLSEISSCNVTGKWTTYNPVIEKACASYSATFLNIYQNVFCFLCNENEDFIYPFKVDCNPIIDISFSFLLEFGLLSEIEDNKLSTSPDEHDVCTAYELYDPFQDTCVAIECILPKVYVEGRCINVAKSISGVIFEVFVKLTPLEPVPIQHFKELTGNLYADFVRIFNQRNIKEKEISLFHESANSEEKQINKDNNNNPSESSIGYMVLLADFAFTGDNKENLGVIDDILALHTNILWTPYTSFKKTLGWFAELSIFEKQGNADHTHANPSETVLISLSNDKPLSMIQIKDQENHNFENEDPIITILPIYNCPVIRLNASFYTIDLSRKGIHIHDLNVSLERDQFVFDLSASTTGVSQRDVMICIDKFRSLTVNDMSNAPLFLYNIYTNIGMCVCILLVQCCRSSV